MFHINNDDEAKPCRAQTPEACRFFKGEDDSRHYENAQDASVESNRLLEAKHGATKRMSKYSFVKEFKEQEKQFNEDFDGFPNRFFNADLQGNVSYKDLNEIDPDEMDNIGLQFVRHKQLADRMFQSTSAPSDMNAADADVEAALARLGVENVESIDDVYTLRSLGATRAWRGVVDGEQIAIIGNKKGKNMERYSFRRGKTPPFERGSFMMASTRTIMGADRAETKTGTKLFSQIAGNNNDIPVSETRREAVRMLQSLNDAQAEGANFRAQRKYIKEHSGSVATAWMDKKNPDKTRQNMMENTKLNKVFSKVEIDNDVDPAEYADFEKSYTDAAKKLPPIPGDRKPELRIRKLGKHKATGVYFPHKNTICIDVRDSSAFVHEYGHYLDLTVQNNQSLQSDFRGIANSYKKNLTVPAGGKQDYYTTPTEIHSRLFEMYAHEKLGIDNRLVDPDKFERFDYEPMKKDPEMKQKAFDFFDKVFATDKK